MDAQQNKLQPDDLRALALQLAAFTELLEQRGNHIVQQTHEAAQQLGRTAASTVTTCERMTAAAIEQFRQAAAGALSEGMRRPMEEMGHTMQGCMQRVQSATVELEGRVRSAGKAVTVSAWKAFMASAIASLAVTSVAVYLSVSAHQDMARAEWTGLINTAIANGKLAPCIDGGLCTRMGTKWVRIDR